jgi:TolA-binding protein
MAKRTRVPATLASVPIVGDMVKQADAQARWLQDVVEQNARLMGQLPATMKSFNDSLERFNQTVQRLDRIVGQVERTTGQLIAPLEQLAQRMDRLAAVLGELPGAGLVRRLTGLSAAASSGPPSGADPPGGKDADGTERADPADPGRHRPAPRGRD